MGMMDQDILKVLYTEKQIAARIEAMGMEMYEALKGKDPLFVSVLRGAFVFMADIVRACQVKCDVEFIAVSSYGNATTSSGAVQITHDIQQDITGRHLVVIEDILDYVGFAVPDEFVVGYGLDYCQKYRNLPYIGVLKPEIYTEK